MSSFRAGLLCVALLLPTLALAQDGAAPADGPAGPEAPAAPASTVKKVELAVESKLDGKKEPVNRFQYFLWERLNHFGVRVDSKNAVGHKQYDSWIAKQTKKRAAAEGEDPPLALQISGTQEADYNASEFFGSAQAHNFKGSVRVTVQDAAGAPVTEVAFPFSWGRPTASGLSRAQVQGQFDKMVQTSVALALLDHAAVRAQVPAAKLPALDKWIADERDELIKVLDGSTEAIKTGELARLLRKIGSARQGK